MDMGQKNLLLERFCTVWMAGIAAEKLVYGDAKGGTEDRQKLKLALIEAGLSANLYQQKANWALLQAQNLLEKHQQSYHALVGAMEKGASVEECFQVIQVEIT